MIVFLTKDLMIQSNASLAARQSGATIKAMAKLDGALAAVSETVDAMLLVDLQTPGLVVDDLIAGYSAMENKCRVIAFAQHVEVDLIETARSAGFEAVLTRGQFSRDLPAIVKEYASGC